MMRTACPMKLSIIAAREARMKLDLRSLGIVLMLLIPLEAAVSAQKTSKMAAGAVKGSPLQVTQAFCDKGWRLLLRSKPLPRNDWRPVEQFRGLELRFPKEEKFENSYFLIKGTDKVMLTGDERQALPALVRYDLTSTMDEWHSDKPFSLKLRFFKRQANQIPGYIELQVIDPEGKEKTWLRGYFYATVVKGG